MASNYIARIGVQLDSANLQSQIDKIAKSAKPIKINLNIDESVQNVLNQLNSKLSQSSQTPLKINVDTSAATSSVENLQKIITRIGADGSKSVEEISKAFGTSFDTITSQIDGKVRKVTEYFSSAQSRALKQQQQMENALLQTQKLRREEAEKLAKAQASAINKNQEREYQNQLQIEKQINAELEKSKSILSQISSEYVRRSELESKVAQLEASPNNQAKLENARALTREANEYLQYSNKLLELERRQTEEKQKQAQAQANAINKNQTKDYQNQLALQQKITEEYNKAKTRIDEMKISTTKRLELEQKLAQIMQTENSATRLKDLKNLNTQINTMGKSAMSFGEMLRTAYEKFANKLRLCTEMCIEKQCEYAGKS